MIAAIFVLGKGGPYWGLPNIDVWDIERNAFGFRGPGPVIAHPPCERWGRYWSGGPSAKVKRRMGDDGGCFSFALKCVRDYGGVLEHPEGSHAFRVFDLPRPKQSGGWTDLDPFGGRSCCVAQGHYGHQARKYTWLYGVGINPKELIWGDFKGGKKIDLGFHSKEERARHIKTGICQRLSKRQRTVTPEPFRDLLISLVSP